MRLVIDNFEVRLGIQIEQILLVVDPHVTRGHGNILDDGADGHFVLLVDVIVSGGEHHETRDQRSVLGHLGAEEAISEHIKRDSRGHVITPSIDHQIKISPITRKSEVRMTRRAVKRIVSRIESLKNQLPISRVRSELLPDPLELVEWCIAEIFPLHILLRADLRPGPPTTAIGPCESALGISEEVPEVLGRAEISDLVISINVPHELPKEVSDGEFTESQRGETLSEVNLDRLAEHLLIAKIIPTDDLGALREDLIGDLDVLVVEGKWHKLPWW